MSFFIYFITSIALSLDAFSLSIIYGSIIKEKNKRYLLAFIIGIFHAFMPFLGHFLGNIFLLNFFTNTNIISFVIFLFLGIEMLFNKDDKEIILLSSKINILLFAFTVSVDSFSVGVALSKNNILMPIILFSTISALFTYLGLSIGNSLNNTFGNKTTKLGGLILIMLSFYYLFT